MSESIELNELIEKAEEFIWILSRKVDDSRKDQDTRMFDYYVGAKDQVHTFVTRIIDSKRRELMEVEEKKA